MFGITWGDIIKVIIAVLLSYFIFMWIWKESGWFTF